MSYLLLGNICGLVPLGVSKYKISDISVLAYIPGIRIVSEWREKTHEALPNFLVFFTLATIRVSQVFSHARQSALFAVNPFSNYAQI